LGSSSTSFGGSDVVIGRRGGGGLSPSRHRRRRRHHHHHRIDRLDSIRNALEGARDDLMRTWRSRDDDGDGGADDDANAVLARRRTTAAVATFVAGTAAFHATAFASQLSQQKFLGISTGTRPGLLPSALGMATVALGSWAGHLAGLGTAHALLGGRGGGRRAPSFSNDHDDDDDDGAMGAMMACARRLPELGSAAMRSAGEMTRPMFLGIVVGGGDGKNGNNGGLSAKERRERKEAWMHAARV
jgi:hypothetical protein